MRGSAPFADVAGIMIVCLGALLALLPLAGPGVVSTHDGLIHLQRLIALDGALRDGVLLPRWLPDLAYGYGEPVFLYYAPLAYLPALAVRLLGFTYVSSFEIASGLSLVLSGLAMYLLARSHFGSVAATVSAIVYATLPYQLVDLYVRGALAESWAFVWLPLCAWCVIRGSQTGQARWNVGLGLTLAGLITTHNVTALLFAPLLAVLVAIVWLPRMGTCPRAWVGPVLGFAAGIGLSAWFWLPALAERGLVQLGEILEPALFASFFIRSFPPFRLEPLFDYRAPVSTALGYPIFWPRLGLVQAVISVLGAVSIVKAPRPTRRIMLWAVLLVVLGVTLQLGPAARLYDLVPLLSFVQFPWRWLALVGLGSALLAGCLVQNVSSRASVRVGIGLSVVVASLVSGLALLEPERSPVDERFLSQETTFRAEVAGYGLGTTHSGEYLPVTSGQRNAARFHKTLLDDPRPDADGSASPSELRIERVDWRADQISLSLTADAPDVLTLHQFAFPGWTAQIDGQAAPIVPSGPLGLISVMVPTGAHTVRFEWQFTPIRTAALGVSLAALLLLAAAGGWHRGVRWARRFGGLPSRFMSAGVGVLMLTLGAVTALVVPSALGTGERVALARSSPAGQVGDRLTLLDSEIDTTRLASDRLLTANLTWFVRSRPVSGYRAHLDVVAQDARTHLGPWIYEAPSRHWQRGEIVRTTIAVRLPDDFVGGPTAVRLTFDEPDGIPPIELSSVVVPMGQPGEDGSGVAEGVIVTPGLAVSPGRVAPVGFWGGAPARAGHGVDVELQWRATQPLGDLRNDYVTVVSVRAPEREIASAPARPGEWYMPLPFWQAGDVIRQRLRLDLPATLAPGTYSLVARIYPRELGRGGMAAPGTADERPHGRPTVEIPLGDVVVGQ